MIEYFLLIHEMNAGKGFGSQFIDYVKNSTEQDRIFLWVLEKNISARRFYENNGFLMTGDSRRISRGIEFKQIRYEWVRKAVNAC